LTAGATGASLTAGVGGSTLAGGGTGASLTVGAAGSTLTGGRYRRFAGQRCCGDFNHLCCSGYFTDWWRGRRLGLDLFVQLALLGQFDFRSLYWLISRMQFKHGIQRVAPFLKYRRTQCLLVE